MRGPEVRGPEARGPEARGSSLGDRHALRLRPRHRAPRHRQQQVAEVSRRRAAALGRRHGLRLAGAGDPRAARAGRARRVRLRLRGAGVRPGIRGPPAEALRLDGVSRGGRHDRGRDPRLQRGLPRAHPAGRRAPHAGAGLSPDPPLAGQSRADARRGPARPRSRRPLRRRIWTRSAPPSTPARARSCSATRTTQWVASSRREELAGMAEICLERDLAIIADEIHCDLLYQGQRTSRWPRSAPRSSSARSR